MNSHLSSFDIPPANEGPPYDVDVGMIYTFERDLMPPLLTTLARSGRGLRMHFVVVDNASADGADQWRSLVPGMTTIKNEKRLGYAANLNRVLQVATAPYVLLLNTDMYFAPSAENILRMKTFMDAHPRCGIASCRIYHPQGDFAYSARRFPTLQMILSRRLPGSPFFKRALDRYLYAERKPEQTYRCDWLSGCYLMIRRQALHEVGMFDSRFGKYFEDVDMCLRMTLAGWHVMTNGNTHAYHYEQRASRRTFSQDGWMHLKSYARWLCKWGRVPRRVTASLDQQMAIPAAEQGVPGPHRSIRRHAVWSKEGPLRVRRDPATIAPLD